VRQDGFGQTFDGKQMEQLAIFIELRVSSVQHAWGSCSASGFFLWMSRCDGLQFQRASTLVCFGLL
jgi:hypothetical protein